MAPDVRVVAPRRPLHTDVRESRRTSSLPEELVSEQIERLALFAAITGGLWFLGLIIDVVLVPLTWTRPISGPAVTMEVVGLSFAGLMYWYARYCTHPGRTKTDVSLGFLVVNAIGVAVLNTWIAPPPQEPFIHLSWVTAGILIFAMVSPAPPGKILAVSLVAASMDPLAMGIAWATGDPIVSWPRGLVMVIPNYACAVIATLPSRVLYRLGRRLREAQELGSYQLVELLGHGGMGEVWRAQHQLLARQAAIKLVRPEVLGARDALDARVLLRRFEREAQATASLSSPHTIQLFDFGVTGDGAFYYVMELLAGRDLETLVREFGPLPAERVVFLLRQAAHSLADAHARGMVHRDIKPANIYVCRMGLEYDFVKVLDFGLVKVRHRDHETETMLTIDHTTTGTPAYMAPEIIMGESDVDRRADVYALGCVAYYLLTGSLVFDADTPMKMLLRHVHDTPAPPSARTELPIPHELDDLVLRCLEKDPDKRPQNAEALFHLCAGCKCDDTWSQQSARRWWTTHLPELAGPLVGPAPAEDSESRAVAVV
jgi:serine/threonine-protein kinase